MCDADYDWPEPLVDAERKARKEHRCFACRELIRPGERYHYTAQIYDGDFSGFKHCARCWALCAAILDAGAESVQWDLHCGVSWREAFGEEPPEKVAALAFMTPEEAQKLDMPDSGWEAER